MRVWSRQMLFGGGLILALLAGEGVFRTLPVETGYFLRDTTQVEPVARRVGSMRAVTSNGWEMRDPVERWINAAGFLSDIEYDNAANGPLISLIGDSQIEAPRVRYVQTLGGRLADSFPDRRIYAFAMSGASLPQYALWAEYARQEYQPELTIFFLSFNDLAESYRQAGVVFPGFHYLNDKDDQTATLTPYRRGIISHLAEYSHLASWLLHNLQLPHLIAGANAAGAQTSSAAMSWFLTRIGEVGFTGRNTLIVINPQSTQELDDTDAGWNQGIELLRKNGFSVVDLRLLFEAETKAQGDFTQSDGIHWTEAGHEVMAHEITVLLKKRFSPN